MTLHVYDRATHQLHLAGGLPVQVPSYVYDCRVGTDLADNVATWARANAFIRRNDAVAA